MDHEQIEEENVVERYILGRLGPEEEALFEEHLLECQDCRQRVSWEDDFRTSLQGVAAEEAARAVARAGVLAWLGRRSALRNGLLAAAALLLMALPAAWLLRERARLNGEIARLQATLARPVEKPSATPAPPSSDGDSAERADLAEKLAEELRAEQEAKSKLAEQLARLTRPQVNVPIFTLGFVRGEDAANRVETGSTPEWIVLAVELPAEEAPSYRATLTDAAGKTLWQGAGLRPTAEGTVTISLYSEILKPGPHRLRLEAVDAGGRASPAGEIPFVVSPPA